jgi:hypothetical protein
MALQGQHETINLYPIAILLLFILTNKNCNNNNGKKQNSGLATQQNCF